jgi:hypothetical protein
LNQRWAIALSVFVFVAPACDAADAVTPGSIEAVRDDAGWQALLGWAALPTLHSGRYRQFSSRDRDEASAYDGIDAGNKDFDGFLAVCGSRPELSMQQVDDVACDPGLEGYLIASDDDGPGYVSRIWLTTGRFSSDGPNANWSDERILIYADDLTVPVYQGRLADWQARTSAPFMEPLTTWSSDAITSYVPISYTSQLRIVLDDLRESDNIYFYQVDLQSSGPTQRFDRERLAPRALRSWDALQAVSAAAPWVNETLVVAAAETVELLDRREPGTIEALRFTLDDAAALRTLRLQAAWDDEPSASIDLPLALLFGESQRLQPFATLPMNVSTDHGRVTLSLSLPMPFASAARLALHNTGGVTQKIAVRIAGTEQLPSGDFGRLHATWRQSLARSQRDADATHVVADLQGRGKYVGTLLLLQGRQDEACATPSPLDFLEGDESAIVDGISAIEGTGTEDFLNGAWYFGSAQHDTPFAALIDLSTNHAAHSGALSAVRWHILHDAIPFEQTFHLSFEIGAKRPASLLQYDTVAFYYLE